MKISFVDIDTTTRESDKTKQTFQIAPQRETNIEGQK